MIAKPTVGLATAEVYRAATVPERPEEGEEMRRALAAGEVEAIGRHLHNRLQEAAVQLRPEIAAVLERLRAQGPAGVMLSGSGTSFFALCRDPGEAQRIAAALHRSSREVTPRGSDPAEDLQVYVVRSCS